MLELIFNGFQHLGVTYDTNPGQFRCNSFAAYCYNSVGYKGLNNLASYKQARHALKMNGKINYSEMKPGDLIFFNGENNSNCNDNGPNGTCSRIEAIDRIRYHVHHIAIYIGDGKIIESTSSVNMVRVNDFNPNTTNQTYYPVLYANILDK